MKAEEYLDRFVPLHSLAEQTRFDEKHICTMYIGNLVKN
jgi:hypothetical protein